MMLFTRFTILITTLFLTVGAFSQTNPTEVSLQVDGSKRSQQIDGIGINANTSSWNGKELEPALELLLDSMHATLWRVIVETVEKWEDENDNNDPFKFNWAYYNKLYQTPKFKKAWDMIRYLNKRGITDKLMINFMGAVPLWMGGEIVKPEYEDEYIEMLVSFFYYAKNTEHLKIGLISLMNEPDIRKEGPTVKPGQYARLFKKFITRLNALGMGDIRHVAPDVAGMENGLKNYIPLLMKDPAIMKKIAHFGLHSYAGYYAPVDSVLKHSRYPKSDFWVTEWNAWCNGCDEGKLGEYNYDFASKCVGFLLDLVKNGAKAGFAWEGFDSYYEHHAPSPFSYWGMLSYDPTTKTYLPRKNFYAIQQVSNFVVPGSWQVDVSRSGGNLQVLAFYDPKTTRVSIVGINQSSQPLTLNGSLKSLPLIGQLELYHTDSIVNVQKDNNVDVTDKTFKTTIPAKCIFTLTGLGKAGAAIKNKVKPEPADWYTGDIHVHLNCGDGTIELPENKLAGMMETNDLAVISLLADMGNGEVKDSKRDLPKVNGSDAAQSRPGRIIHWDTEWHWDATYSNFNHQALGGHLVLLGLKEAKQIWEESPYKILDWAKKQQAVKGFAHFEYLNDSIQHQLNCCIPVDYPVEAALGNIDFVSEDVFGTTSPNNGNYNSEAAINAYYKLLNCGFRPGLAAGTDYPCNNNEPLGTLLTYVKVKDKLTYAKWIKGIKEGRTVVSRNGHNEFIELKANGKYSSGDEIKIKNKGTVNIEVKWTANKLLSGKVELVSNGKVVTTMSGTAQPGKPMMLKAMLPFTKSGWICARRMDDKGHQLHSAAIYVNVDDKPVRASAEDAEFFIAWIDHILQQTAPGGAWDRYFTKDVPVIKERYQKARAVYEQILKESK
ncbi:MAG: CehA/McbA family metallohydrolase [Ferruginibacter sp.]